MIWDATGSVMSQTISFYTGQPLKKNFRFEIWNTSQGVASQATAVTIYTSKAGTVDYRWGDDTTLVGNDGQITNFNATVSVVGSIIVAGAGEPLANGVYVPRVISNQWISPTGDFILFKTPTSGSNALYSIRLFTNNNVLYIVTPPTSLPIGSLTWALSTFGTAPAPTTTQPSVASFNVPVTFPTTSVSTTN